MKNLIYKEDGSLQPIKMELYESSGPVSPLYQYIVHIKIHSTDKEIHLHYKNIGKNQEDGSKKNVQWNKVISLNDYLGFITKLIQNNVFSLNHDFIGDERRKKIGISFNFFELTLGKETVKFQYLLQDKKQPEFENYEKIINIVKNLNTEK